MPNGIGTENNRQKTEGDADKRQPPSAVQEFGKKGVKNFDALVLGFASIKGVDPQPQQKSRNDQAKHTRPSRFFPFAYLLSYGCHAGLNIDPFKRSVNQIAKTGLSQQIVQAFFFKQEFTHFDF